MKDSHTNPSSRAKRGISNYLSFLNKIRMNTQQLQGATATGGNSPSDCVPSAGIDFGYCGIQQTESRSFTLSNPTSVVPVKFEF